MPSPQVTALGPTPRVSVVIAAFNEERAIGRCLGALRRERRPGIEVIVADDGSTDATASVAAESYPEARVLRLSHRGSTAAQNEAVRLTRAPRIAFLDSDCIPCPGWLDAVLAASNDPAIHMGRVVPEPTFRSRFLALLGFGEFVGRRPMELENFALLNLSGPAEVFRLHPFPEAFIGADRVHSFRLARLAVPIRFDPAQAVVHAPGTDLCAMLRRQISYAERFVENRRREPRLTAALLVRAGPLFAPILAAGRLIRDLERLRQSRAALGLSALSAAGHALAIAGFRSIDALGMTLYMLRSPAGPRRLPGEP